MTLKVDMIEQSDGSPVTLTGQAAAKAYCNWDSLTTLYVRDSLNISSITDVGIGQATLNFSNSFANTDYLNTGSGHRQHAVGNLVCMAVAGPSVSSVDMYSMEMTTAGIQDRPYNSNVSYGELS